MREAIERAKAVVVPSLWATSTEYALCEAMDADIRGVAARLAAESGLPIVIEPVSADPAQPFHADCIAAVARAAERLGCSNMPVVSGAGHDACYLNRVCPTSMIFTPCVDGISHNEVEDIKPEWSTAGANVLMYAVLEKAEIVA